MDIKEILKEYTTICILGQKGTGKTYAAAILANALPTAVMLDTVGEWTRKNLIRDAVYIRVPPDIQPQKLFSILNKYIGEKKVVIDASGWLSYEYVEFADKLFPYLMSRGNVPVFVDEIAGYCPQDKSVYSGELERAVLWGRNYGLRPFVFISQRPQKANKEVLALADYYVFFRLMHNLDRAKIRDLVGKNKEEWEELEKKIMGLETRNAYVFYMKAGTPHMEPVLWPEIKGGK